LTYAAVREDAKAHQADDIPEGFPEDTRFILAFEFAKKYGLHWRYLPDACRKGFLTAQRRKVPDLAKRNFKRILIRWFIFDIPPDEHPGWTQYTKNKIKKSPKTAISKKFSDYAPVFLERFKDALSERVMKGEATSDFKQSELAKILQVPRAEIGRWREIGIKGYGKLPYRILSDDKRAIKSGDCYVRQQEQAAFSGADYYYHQKDIVRFLTKQYNEKKKFKTLSDAVADTNLEDIAAEHGYYVYDAKKTYPMTEEGFLRWIKDKVRIYDPVTDQGIKMDPNEKQRELYAEVFRKDPKGDLLYKLICLCRPRGDYKTTDVCLIVLFFFYNRPRQKIYLIACNSETQAEHLLMDEIKQIIEYSPDLKNQTWLVIQENEIHIKAGKKTIYSFIKTASIKAGTLSNSSIFVFTEFFDLSDRMEFAKLEGSTRFRANAFTIAEGIATDENHIWHEFYRAFIEGKDPKMYFQWYGDAWYNPRSTAEERDHFRVTHGEAEYIKHFRNIWGGTASHFVTQPQLIEVGIAGIDNHFGPSKELTDAITEFHLLTRKIHKLEGAMDITDLKAQRHTIKSRFIPMDDIYKLPAKAGDVEKLMDTFGFDYYAIGMGVDRAKQMSKRSDRTAIVTLLRAPMDEYNWLCFVLNIFLPPDSTMDIMLQHMVNMSNEFGIITGIDLEEYQCRDVYDQLQLRGFEASLVPQSFKHQDEMFPMFYTLVSKGMFKSPTVPLWFDETSKVYHSFPPDGVDDILRAEMGAFIEIERIVEGGVAKKVGYYGSKFKMNKTHRVKPGEPNDDVMMATGHAIHSLRSDMYDGFSRDTKFAEAHVNKDVIGDYPEVGAFLRLGG